MRFSKAIAVSSGLERVAQLSNADFRSRAIVR
jgi:hypothetical protein